MPSQNKPRITLADLESVEVRKVDIADATADPASTPYGDAPAEQGAAPSPHDSAELSSLPIGVSPEVARLLAPDPPPSEPGPAEPAAAAVVVPEAKRSKLGVPAMLAAVVVAGGVAAAVLSRPAPLPEVAFTGEVVAVVALRDVDHAVGFRPIPDPIVLEASPAEAASTPRAPRERRPEPRSIRGEDLF